MEEDNKLPYFLLGLGVGAALGVMFAPKAGAETREYLKSKAGDLRETAGEVLDRSRDVLQRQKENLSAAVDAGRSAYREVVNSPQGD